MQTNTCVLMMDQVLSNQHPILLVIIVGKTLPSNSKAKLQGYSTILGTWRLKHVNMIK